ncbi:SARP family transcriptional regulator [Actinoplanes sp. SE50]|uniref:AfsR/SARP family transcriptional regulator n=1 Tax=unclassified Actinoplanes TaxID=2626549 RepID=UPI00023EC3CB|nr:MULTISPECIES: AfsR/SARP family transcriptional regulator [unclassified Actinoplanes]AEV81888.1 Regulatory protein afsR [Actinoplanes sp. SE50/110]ATO80289.1 SARP family transcriptional regulator [Actinoplanes sp. SE50]SLL97694.1 SARP family transcriptional regulator [Actinoplanes sp. SE50/110]
MTVEFRVLGPLDALIDGQRIDVGGNRQQIVLASLVLEAGSVISIDRLMRAVYGESLPSSARVQVQICVSALRRLFGQHGHPKAIVTRNQGYVLAPTEIDVDLQRYESLVMQARAAGNAGRKEESTARYREALALWRGPALEGLDSEPLRMVADRLAERRLTVTEDCIEYDLELGRHREVIAELVGLVGTYPLRERLRGQLMLALYRSGRQAEALDAYRAARRTLIDELGLEPSEWLQQLERSILASDADLSAPEATTAAVPLSLLPVVEPEVPPPDLLVLEPEAARAVADPAPAARGGQPVPSMLPTDIADFTGRTEQIEAIQAHLTAAAGDPAQLAVPIIVVAGKPGIGKTALGIHVSHRLAPRYPDGQLFADLHGRSSDRVSPMQILERFLRTLGVPGASIPDGLEERAEMYRGLLSDRRMLVVLDNAGSEAQVLPLLPGNPRTAVLITTRSRLGALPGAVHVDIDVLDPSHCVALLSRIAGDDRVLAETDAVAALTELCGRLPLALRIAGARLSARPHWSVEQLADRLENESRRLDELNHGAMGVRVSISLTYDNISDAARRLFRLLAVVDSPAFSAWVCAALLDEALPDAYDLLDDLVDAQLVEIDSTEPGPHRQYRFHDLIRVFARERLAAEEPLADRNAALQRVFGGLLFLSEEAHRKFYGEGNKEVHSAAPRWRIPQRSVDRMLSDPLGWFERERQSIVAAVRQAAEVGAVEYCWDLAVTAVTLFETRVYLNDWRTTHEIALAAVRRAGDRLGHGMVLYSMGALTIAERRFAEGRRRLEDALEMFEVLGEESGHAMVNRHLAYLERMDGNLDEAARRYEQVLPVVRRGGNPAALAYVLHSMAQIEMERGNAGDAKAMLEQSLELSRRVGGRRIEAQVLHRLGQAHLQAGEPESAVTVFGEALTAAHGLGDPIGEAYATLGLGAAYLSAGDLTEAGAALARARELASINGERLIEARVEFCMGELSLAADLPDAATTHLERALVMFREIHAPLFEERVLAMLQRTKNQCRVA